MWAEDGRIFLAERDELGPWRSILHPYEGYLHVVPRLLSDAAGVVASWEHYAVAVTALSCLTVGAVAALVFLCTREVIGSTAVRVALAATTVLVPAGPVETTGNLANVHWYLLWLTAWLVLARPRRRRHAVILGVVALLAGLSEIQTVLFLPLALLRWRDRCTWPITAGLAVGCAAQIIASVCSPRAGSELPHPSVLDHVKGFLIHVVASIWDPSADGSRSVLSQGWWLVLLAAVPFVGAVVVLAARALLLLRRRPFDREVLTLAAVVGGATVPFAAALIVNRESIIRFDSYTLSQLAGAPPLRHGVVPSMFLIAAVLVVVDLLGFGTSRRRSLLAGVLLVGVMGLQVVHVLPHDTLRSGGPRWAPGVRAALDACAEQRRPPAVAVPPYDFWDVVFTCGPDGRLVDARPAVVIR